MSRNLQRSLMIAAVPRRRSGARRIHIPDSFLHTPSSARKTKAEEGKERAVVASAIQGAVKDEGLFLT